MTPRELQTKWAISRTLMPTILDKGYRRIDDYLAGSCEIPDSVRSQCWLIDFYLTNGGSILRLIEIKTRNYC
jgi:hypothetical protein